MDELDEFLGCRIDNSRLRGHTVNEKTLKQLHSYWNRCPFCSASRGLYGATLEQHKPRCRYKGDSNSLEFSFPNYLKMIDEDDSVYLPMIRALAELPVAKRKLAELLSKIEKASG